MLQDLSPAYLFVIQVCGLVECALCVCGNYCDINAGSAGETGCLLINERSRWPRVGGSLEHTASRSGGQHNTDTWAITNKTSQAADISQRYFTCVSVFMHVFSYPFLCMAVLPVSQQKYLYSFICMIM